MKFEEALTALRQGARIRHPTFADDEYLAGCYVTLKTIIDDDGKELIDDAQERGMNIVRVKGDWQHDSMGGKLNYVNKIKRQLKNILTEDDYKKYHNLNVDMYIADIFDNDIFAYPQLNLFLVMADDWEIFK